MKRATVLDGVMIAKGPSSEVEIAAGFALGELVKIPDHLMQSYLGHMSGIGIIVSTWTVSGIDPTVRLEVLWPDGNVVNMVPSYLEHVTEIAI